MTKPVIAEPKEYLIKIGMDHDADYHREGVHLLSQGLMEVEVEQQVGARKRQ